MTKLKEFKGHPIGAWLVIATVMWEYFSYYGMRALLVLYLSQKLLFTDANAFNLYGTYTSLIYVTPIVGGYIADKLLGYRWSAILGGCIIALGHFILAIGGLVGLYLGLACLVAGIGFFKTNALSLLGEFYPKDRIHRQNAYNFFYAGGNVGASLAGLLCGWVAYTFGWHYGFILAGIGMVIGLTIMTIGRHHLIGKGDHKILSHHQKKLQWFLPVGIIFFICFIVLIIYQLLAGWVLLFIGIISIFYVGKVHIRCNRDTRSELTLFYILTLASTLFWAFDQQGGSSINLFISRNINRLIHLGSFNFQIPTPMFQSINPIVILIATPFISMLWLNLARKKMHISSIIKFGVGFLLLTSGFSLITLGAQVATISGKANMLWIIAGMMLVGIAELFIEPVALAFVSRVAPKHSLSVMIGLYYLFTGAIANYIAAQIAKMTTYKTPLKATLIEYAHGYESIYFKIVIFSLMLLIVMILFRIIFRKLSVK